MPALRRLSDRHVTRHILDLKRFLTSELNSLVFRGYFLGILMALILFFQNGLRNPEKKTVLDSTNPDRDVSSLMCIDQFVYFTITAATFQ